MLAENNSVAEVTISSNTKLVTAYEFAKLHGLFLVWNYPNGRIMLSINPPKRDKSFLNFREVPKKLDISN